MREALACVFPPHGRICKHPDKDTSDHGASLKTLLLCSPRVVPVGQRDARWRLVSKGVRGRKQSLELLLVVSQRGGPGKPIDFGVIGPVVERQAVFIGMARIELQLFPDDLSREDVKVQ